MSSLTIGHVAKNVGVTVETIRYYEKRGLIEAPKRSRSGYRIFSEDVIEDIQFIKRAQHIGFTLSEIKELLMIHKQKMYYPTEEMYQFATTKIQEIEKQITQLNQFKSLLESVTKQQVSKLPLPKNECPIIQTLS